VASRGPRTRPSWRVSWADDAADRAVGRTRGIWPDLLRSAAWNDPAHDRLRPARTAQGRAACPPWQPGSRTARARPAPAADEARKSPTTTGQSVQDRAAGRHELTQERALRAPGGTEEPREDSLLRRPRLDKNLAWDATGGIAQGESHHYHVVQRTDHGQELGDQVDRREDPKRRDAQGDLRPTRHPRVLAQSPHRRRARREHGCQVLGGAWREPSSEDDHHSPRQAEQTHTHEEQPDREVHSREAARTSGFRWSPTSHASARTTARRLAQVLTRSPAIWLATSIRSDSTQRRPSPYPAT